MKNESEFVLEMITQLMDTQRVGLAAILVGDRAEAQYLLDKCRDAFILFICEYS